jgi:hypothetical protein
MLLLKWHLYCCICYKSATFNFDIQMYSFMWFPEFRQNAVFCLVQCNIEIDFRYFYCTIFLVWGWFSLQGIEKTLLPRRQRKKRGWTAVFNNLQTLLCCIVIHTPACIDRLICIFLYKKFIKIWQLSVVYYEFEPP